MAPDDTAAFWDDQAATFDDEPDHGLRDPQTRAAWWTVLGGALPAAPARVADLGCGTGSVSLLLAEHGYAVSGIDLAPAMVERAKLKLADYAECDFVVGDASAPPLSAGSFDVVLARHVVWALPEPAQALRRWADLLVPGGRLLLVEGFWSTGSGLHAAEVVELLPETITDIAVFELSDAQLWGKELVDERYLVTGARR